MEKHETNASNKCLDCGHPLPLASDARGGAAKAGPNDFSICIRCGSVGVFQADLSLRRATEADLAELDAETLQLIRRTQFMARAFNRTFSNS